MSSRFCSIALVLWTTGNEAANISVFSFFSEEIFLHFSSFSFFFLFELTYERTMCTLPTLLGVLATPLSFSLLFLFGFFYIPAYKISSDIERLILPLRKKSQRRRNVYSSKRKFCTAKKKKNESALIFFFSPFSAREPTKNPRFSVVALAVRYTLC